MSDKPLSSSYYSLVAVEATLDKITPDPVEEIDTNKYIETIYENMMSFDDW